MDHERVERLFILFGGYLKVPNNAAWAEILGYADASSVSRVRNGKLNLTEDKIRILCEKCGLDRFEFDLPVEQLVKRLGMTSYLPVSVSKSSQNFDILDVKLIDTLRGNYILLYPGRADAHEDYDVTRIERLKFESTNIAGTYGNSKEFHVLGHSVVGEDVEGTARAHGGVLHMSVEYSRHICVPSSYLFDIMIDNAAMKVWGGIYLDVTEERNPTIFSTQCVMFDIHEIGSLPAFLSSQDPLHSAWKRILANEIAHRDKLLSPKGESVLSEVKNLVKLTRQLVGK